MTTEDLPVFLRIAGFTSQDDNTFFRFGDMEIELVDVKYLNYQRAAAEDIHLDWICDTAQEVLNFIFNE